MIEFFDELKQILTDYKAKVKEIIDYTVPEYIKEALRFLHFEQKQAEYYYQQSLKKIISLIEEISITEVALFLIKVIF